MLEGGIRSNASVLAVADCDWLGALRLRSEVSLFEFLFPLPCSEVQIEVTARRLSCLSANRDDLVQLFLSLLLLGVFHVVDKVNEFVMFSEHFVVLRQLLLVHWVLMGLRQMNVVFPCC